MGSTSRITSLDSARTHERYPVWEGIAPIPPESLLWSVGGSSVENFLAVSDFWAQMMAPYLAWTGFAGVLNEEIVRRNPDE